MAVVLRSDRGSASLQIVVCLPLVLMVIMLIIQSGVYYNACNTAQVAADMALAAARTSGGDASRGQSQAEHVLTVLGSGVLSDARIHVDRSTTTVTVAITAGAPHFVPFWPSTIRVTSTGPVEVYTVRHHG